MNKDKLKVKMATACCQNQRRHPRCGTLRRVYRSIELEFALRDINKPIGVSEYTLTEILPENLKGSLPTVEEIEADLKLLEETNKQKKGRNIIKGRIL